ncbi:MAG: MBOAT family O-acyltransferase [Thiobacillaceae bacterium]
MIFSSSTFMVFFAVVLFLYAGAQSYRQRAAVILVASLIFYASWKPAYLLLLGASLSLNYLLYRCVQRSPARSIRAKAWVTVALVLNLGVLTFYKYLALAFETVVTLEGWLGVSPPAQEPGWVHWALPLGISFYTFHMLSVMIDVYRGDWQKPISFKAWTLYVTFFPHMIAGPILRASELVEQLENLQPLKLDQLRLGALIFIAGLLKKSLFADNLAPIVASLYAQPGQLDFHLAWLATLGFAAQIYFDFSGYSEMAIGLARVFGVTLPRNFRYPYVSHSVQEFWQRWHMTLSRWLRDYLYISLGGSRRGYGRNLANLMITMLLGGLWHGAGWNFVFWGFLHGSYLVGHRVLVAVYKQFGLNVRPRISAFISWSGLPLTFILVNFAWVFFRATRFHDAWLISSAMLGLREPIATPVEVRLYLQIFIVFALMLAWFEPYLVRRLEKLGVMDWWRVPALLRGASYATLVLALTVFGGGTQKFIYFDF